MGIQDLGAIGEFIGSLVIVMTLMVFIYEVRGNRQANLQADAQERQRKRDDLQRSQVESRDLADIFVAANQHPGLSIIDRAAEFGIEPAQYQRLSLHFSRVLLSSQDAYMADLPLEEHQGVVDQLRFLFGQPAFAKWYEVSGRPIFGEGRAIGFFDHIEEMRPVP